MDAPLPLSFRDIAGAPVEGTVLCKLDDLKNNKCVELTYREGDKLFLGFICRHEGVVRAYENNCPHTGSPLNMVEAQFFSNDLTQLQCRTHDARFNPKNGRCTQGPCLDQWLTQLLITIDGDRILAG